MLMPQVFVKVGLAAQVIATAANGVTYFVAFTYL